MKLIDNVLYIEFQEAVQSGISEAALKKAKLRKSSSWSFIDDPEDRRKVLVEYQKLALNYKEKIIAKFGNPYEHVARQPIFDMVKWDLKAEAFFLVYKYNGNKTLPLDHVKKYTSASSWLNMLKEATEDKKVLKDRLKLSIDSFYKHVIELVKLHNISLPTSYRRLLAKRAEYDKEGYASMIDWRFGNTMAAKVKDELSESVLLEMIAHGNQYDDVLIAHQYNVWAKANNYEEIHPATVGIHRRKNDHLIIMGREGNAALNGKYLKQVKGFRPSAPLYLVENDDNHLDFLFEDPDNKQASKRYIAMVVTDSYNDLVLGYAYAPAGTLSEGQSIALVKAAYVNAMYYVRSLTQGWYLPHETKSDRWANKSLSPFYESMGKRVVAALGNSRRGYIEEFFGSAHWKRCVKLGANNYSGNNISAKFRGVNMELLAKGKKERALIGEEASNQIEQFFHRLRHMPQASKNGVKMSKEEQWLDAWNATSHEKKRLITDEQFLIKFGIEHNYRGEGKRITNRGIEPEINGIKYSYDLEEYSMEHINKVVSIMYDPYDMSRVLVTDFEKIRIMGFEARKHSRALKDASTDSRTYLNAVLQEKRDQVGYVATAADNRKKVLAQYTVDAESVLLQGLTTKEITHDAEAKMLNAMINQKNENPDDFDIFDQM